MQDEETIRQVERILSLVLDRTPWSEWPSAEQETLLEALEPPVGDPREKDAAEALGRVLFGRRIALFGGSERHEDRAAELRRRLLETIPFGVASHLGEQIEEQGLRRGGYFTQCGRLLDRSVTST